MAAACCAVTARIATSAELPARSAAAFPQGRYAALDQLPDWGGVWVLNRGRPAGAAAPEQPRLKGEYLARYQAWQQQARANNGVALKENSNCLPPGMPRMMGTGQYPIEFLFTPGRVTMQHEAWMQTRAIFTDGRGHPADLEAGFFGHSVGHWEGDALVVDTVGIKTVTELETGMRHSDKLRVAERIRLAPGDPDTLVVETTLTDPEALEAPYRRIYTFKRERDWNLMEFVCAENDRNPVGPDGVTRFN
ncbi:MAG: hypothetical protein ABW278_13755 [Steroidobacteraceae bacterium]